jgi:hypothetical protein
VSTQVHPLTEIIRFAPEELLEHLAMLLANGNIWHLPRLYRRLGAAALEAGLITSEGEASAEGYALAALYEEPTKDQRLFTEVTDEPVPGPFAIPNVKA